MDDETIGAMKADIKWIKKYLEKADKKYAPKWIVWPVQGFMGVIGIWAINQLLDMIPKAYAIVLAYTVTIS